MTNAVRKIFDHTSQGKYDEADFLSDYMSTLLEVV